ncbi:MAG: adenylate/guanylate cyclase domain-containing protein [Myxococcota bacterium]
MPRIAEQVVTHTALDVEAAWALVGDTERLNREAGLSPITMRPSDRGGPAPYLVRTTIGPFLLEYEELPFEWKAPEQLVIRRRMIRAGPAKELVAIFTVSRTPQGCDITTRIEVELTGLRWLAPGKIVAKIAAARIQAAFGRLAAHETRRSKLPRSAWDRAEEALRRETPEALQPLVPKLFGWLMKADDLDASRIRPYVLAEAIGAERRAALELCLYAVVSGALELSWDLVCPSCRTASGRGPSLSEIGESGHCTMCDITYELDFDRAIEATFRPSRSLRPIEEIQYCTGGPSATPHVLRQLTVWPKQSAEMEAPAEPGRYRLFARGGAIAPIEVQAGAAERVELLLGAEFQPGSAVLAPGAHIRVLLDGDSGRHVKLERLDWANQAATAHDISVLPLFRERFSGEVLRPGLALKVARVTLVFTDLGASTELYSKRGDAVAFRLVHDHFELLSGLIAEQGGTIVKTIGDAVMASFTDEGAAFRAAAAMNKAFANFRAARAQADRLSLKIGLYTGACYLVTANGLLDYFGQTVNLAARLQAQAKDDEIVLSTETADRLRASGDLGSSWASEAFLAELKGISGPVEAVRLSRRR